MAKKKYPSELNSKTVRINLGTYQLLAELATKNGLTIAEALDLLITNQTIPARPTMARAQMPMPVFSSQAKPVLSYRAKPVISINGNKHTSFAMKPKGGIIDGG